MKKNEMTRCTGFGAKSHLNPGCTGPRHCYSRPFPSDKRLSKRYSKTLCLTTLYSIVPNSGNVGVISGRLFWATVRNGAVRPVQPALIQPA